MSLRKRPLVARFWLSILALALLTPPSPTPAGSSGQQPTWRDRLPEPSADGYYYRRGRQPAAKVELGRLLFFDKILSGNLNISCATCHHPLAGTGDGLSLSVGEGGRGLGVTRDTGSGRERIRERVPRNAPPLFNLGARQFRRMFHDGRVEKDPRQPTGIRSPAGVHLPAELDNVLAAQAMFPVTSTTEMAGQAGENRVADAAEAGDMRLVWKLLADRLRAVPEYVDRFLDVYGDLRTARDIRFAHAANAIAAFEADAWRSDDSPFDRYLRGDARAMSRRAVRGMRLFYGALGCVDCHSGVYQTDHRFHAIAMPQIGPGKGDGPDGHDDFGRERVSGTPFDRFRFRTPSLRNVALTGPWGHDGAYNTLRAVLLHHFDPVGSLASYDPRQSVLPSRPDLDAADLVVISADDRRQEIAAACELEPRSSGNREGEIEDLLAFLHALTDPAALDLRTAVPAAVPSGLPLAD